MSASVRHLWGLLLLVACQQVPRAVASQRPLPAVVEPGPRCLTPDKPRPIADHVIILSEDGLRPDALAQAHAPVHEELMREGAYTMHARTIRRASTLPSHAAMLSGFDVEAHGLSWNSWQPSRGFIKVPTVFSVATDAGQEAVAFVGKRKLEHIAQPGSVAIFSNPGYLCRKVVGPAAEHFRQSRPQIEFVHFSDPDSSGHSVGWMSDDQLVAIGHSDDCLGKLVEAIKESDPTRTLLIISADHGGRGRNHSGAREEDLVIPWIAWGAGVRPGHRITAPVSTVDTAATALWALGYAPSPGGAGHPVAEAFLPR
jgi:predicted AlkP superfamily pyrophosphatase or phosphodiesterase